MCYNCFVVQTCHGFICLLCIELIQQSKTRWYKIYNMEREYEKNIRGTAGWRVEKRLPS